MEPVSDQGMTATARRGRAATARRGRTRFRWPMRRSDAPVRCAGPMRRADAGVGADTDTEGAYVPYGPGDFGQ
ncbi:hypothetical protein SCMC78_42370 [Streptomyces sp. CMC78]|uniref:Uncharacterized protein n=1 Tax=Streptomyces sp. CMC78 TaxID=3231512 RepID=A0AB33KRR3_9ACTN